MSLKEVLVKKSMAGAIAGDGYLIVYLINRGGNMGKSKEAEEQYHQEMEEYQDFEEYYGDTGELRALKFNEIPINWFVMRELRISWDAAKEFITDDT